MKKSLIVLSIVSCLLLSLFVFAQGSVTLYGTVRLPDGTPVDGTNLSGEVLLYDIVNFLNISGDIYPNITIVNTSINSTGGYKFENLENMNPYDLLAFYVNSSEGWYQSEALNNTIFMNGSFYTHYNQSLNLTYLNSSTSSVQYDIVVIPVE
jgi:hypothetical protein